MLALVSRVAKHSSHSNVTNDQFVSRKRPVAEMPSPMLVKKSKVAEGDTNAVNKDVAVHPVSSDSVNEQPLSDEDIVSHESQLNETYLVTSPVADTAKFATSTPAVNKDKARAESVSSLSSLPSWPSSNSSDDQNLQEALDMLNDHSVPQNKSEPSPIHESQGNVVDDLSNVDPEVNNVTEPKEASGSSEVDALVAAVYGYESRVISEREARDRLWWFSLNFVDI